MIKLQDYTPDIYYSESRDFQFIGRLFDLVLNYVKTNVDLIYDLPLSDNSDDQFVELLALTLGFKPKHKYVSKQLRAICACLSEIIRNKGSIKAIILACNAIFHAEGITDSVEYTLTNDNTVFTLYLPAGISNTTLLTDLFTYIMPAGLQTNIVKLEIFNEPAATAVGAQDVFSLLTNSTNPDPRHAFYNGDSLATIPQFSETAATDRTQNIVNIQDLRNADANDTQGILANVSVLKKEDNSEE